MYTNKTTKAYVHCLCTQWHSTEKRNYKMSLAMPLLHIYMFFNLSILCTISLCTTGRLKHTHEEKYVQFSVQQIEVAHSRFLRMAWTPLIEWQWVANTTGTCQHEEGQPIQLITRLFIYRYIVHTYVGRYRHLRSIKKARTLPGDLYKMKIRATCPRVFWNMLKVIHTLHTLKWPYLKRKESKQVSRALIH